MIILWIITGVALLVSLAAVSLVLTAVTPRMLQGILSGTGLLPFFSALGVGSIALIPGFIAYPLAAVLRQNGATVPVLAAFITSLMMVGVLTLPLEARYFGWRAALLRNGLALCGAIIVAAGMAWVLR